MAATIRAGRRNEEINANATRFSSAMELFIPVPEATLTTRGTENFAKSTEFPRGAFLFPRN